MTKRKKKPRVVGSYKTYLTHPEFNEFRAAIVAKCREQGVPDGVEIPEDIVNEVVRERYGGWTEQARSFVRIIEAQG